MKKSEAMAVGDLLKAMIESDGNTGTFDREKAAFLWAEIVGPIITRSTLRRYVEGDVLHVYISSGPLKSELAFMTESIMRQINEAIGYRLIKKIQIH